MAGPRSRAGRVTWFRFIARIRCLVLWNDSGARSVPSRPSGIPPVMIRDNMARLLSVNVGLPRDIEWKGRTVHTGIWKDPVPGRCRVGRLNLDGDGQGDLAGHGGEQRAVFVYQIESYRYWEEQLGRTDFVPGQFGENFTVEGLPDDAVCIGDRYRIGSALFEVTQPRVTCYRVGIRMNEPRMPALLTSSGRPGFYFRVLRGRRGGRRRRDRQGGRGARADDRRGGQRAALLARASARSAGARAADRGALARLALVVRGAAPRAEDARASGNAGLAPAAAAHPAAPGFRAARGHGDRSRVGGRPLAHAAEPGRQPLPAALPGQYVVVRLRPTRRRPSALPQLLALGPALDRALSHQRQGRAERRGGQLAAGSCPGGRRARRQLAARQLRAAATASGRSCCSARGSARRR